jgi:hypothetical protein
MYGLPQAGIIAQKLLERRLQQHQYCQSKTTPGLWKHNTRPISFTLAIDNFGVKYMGKENAQHLLSTMPTNARAIGTANNIVASPSSGTTANQRSTYQCPTTSTKPLPSFSTLPHENGRINHTPMCHRPWHYGGKHILLNVAIRQIANR